MYLTQKVGRLTVALTLVGIGLALLLDNLAIIPGAAVYLYKVWPAVLIGFGVEYLVRSQVAARRSETAPPVVTRFDLGGTFLVLLVFLLSFGITTLRDIAHTGTGRLSFIDGPDYSQTHNRTLSAAGTKAVEIGIPVGSVRLQQHPDLEVKVVATYTARGLILDTQKVSQSLSRIRLSAAEGETVHISAQVPSDLENVSLIYTVYAPPHLTVKVSTGAGTINVTDYTGDLTLKSGAGRIQVSSGKGTLSATGGAGQISINNFEGPVTARASVGGIHLTNIIGAMQLDSGSGQITVRQFQGGKLVAETRTGGIQVVTDAILAGDIALKASTGSVQLAVPKESSMRASAQTRAGSLKLPPFMTATTGGTARAGAGSTSDGKYSVTLEASLGSITFEVK